MKFYSENEINTIKSEIEAGVGPTKIARKYAKIWERTEHSLLFKIAQIKKNGSSYEKKKLGRPVGSKTKKTAKVVTQTSSQGVTLRSGFVFDFKPQRAEMYQDHVRLYF